MSRIGRLPIEVPSGVTVGVNDGLVTVQGPKGSLEQRVHPHVAVQIKDGIITVTRSSDSDQDRALHGLTRALVANMVEGVTKGFSKRLVINGVGYRALQEGRNVVLQIGFSHPVEIAPPEGIDLEVEKGGHSIIVSGSDKELVGRIAAGIRDVRKPEPYKGKGIAYEDETIRRKPGKAGRVGGVGGVA